MMSKTYEAIEGRSMEVWCLHRAAIMASLVDELGEVEYWDDVGGTRCLLVQVEDRSYYEPPSAEDQLVVS